MITGEGSFVIMLCLSCGFATWYGYKHGKQYVLGAGMACSMLAGTWFKINALGTEINVSMATAVLLLVAYCMHSWRDLLKSITLLDVLVGALTIWHVVVDVCHEGGVVAVSLRAYGQWMLPYAAGRYAFSHPGSLAKLSPVFAAAAASIATLAIFEAITSINMWETVFVSVDDKVLRIIAQRYGILYRAIGPVRNAIFLGVILLSMAPFAVDLMIHSGISKRHRTMGGVMLFLLALGIVATVSRGPILCILLACAFSLAYINRVLRWVVIAMAVGGVTLATFQFDTVANLLESGGQEHTRSRVLDVDGSGDLELYNNTRVRMLIHKVYWPIVLDGGPLGYGTTDSSGFPPRNIPGLPTDPAVLEYLKYVDNSYINVGLALGWVGLALFVAFLVAAIIQSLTLAPLASTYLYPSDSRVMVAYASVFFAILFELFTVHWSYDFSFWLLFHAGVIAGLASQCARARRSVVN
ncbi:O-antigen ligase family protein [Allorhodopirellula solitaria]|uniref:O-Antigen ligase n=1 Tax=Allorhodopirellula solitaria TaxID=2527987 RepID=A0A5C5WPM3_9BACT|nr:O-antigen ligase family protein [Allorhodopirellula solitaria]TWT52119.1 O-Antigen ligase [Allorhodopirellula solitaria]